MKKFIADEPVLCAAAALAVVSCFLTPPDAEYVGYINFDTLIVLFSLMTVMAGLRELGAFRWAAESLVRRLRSERGLVAVLVGLCFFGSMLITNDVALITFVPLAILILDMEHREDHIIRTVVLMTVAANLGSMLTPIGNPQNLYIYSVSGLTLGQFVVTVLPYAALSALLLALSVVLGFKSAPVSVELADRAAPMRAPDLIFYLALFLLCILTVAKLVSVWVLLPVIAVCALIRDRRLLLKVDYSLLLTFAAFFIFIGNMGRYEPFRVLLAGILEGRVLAVSAILSQAISNVPAALLLSGFTDSWRELLVGVNIGGLGTLIASMASLISFKLAARRLPERKGAYLLQFTVWNLGFLAALAVLAWVIG